MKWEKFFGTAIYSRLKAYCEGRNISMAAIIRDAVIRYLDANEA